ncbi:MAG: ABC transporter permease [Candidatus Acidiferrales bacterium]
MRKVLADFSTDIRYGLRQIRKNLSLTIVCAAVLAIGIGSATAVFAVLYDAILKPLPYRDAAQLVYVHNEFPQSQLAQTNVSGPDYTDLSTHREIFSETAAYYFNDFTMTGAGMAQHVDAVNASATLFPMLGIALQLGRTFSPEEDRDGAAKVVILSDALWRGAFGADRNVLGRSIGLDGAPYRVIGVMPADFNFPYPATQMWVPLALRPSALIPGQRGNKWLQMIARVAPNLTPERANAALAGISHGYAAAYPDDYPGKTGWHFSCAPMVEQQTKAVRSWLLLAFGAVFCVLLIACINVSGLLLVRANIRKGEWAVRAALGASPMRLARQILVETGLLALIGCTVGVLLAISLVRLSNRFGPIHRTTIEPWTFVFSLGLCLLATFLAGVLPATTFSRLPLEQTLRASGPRTSAGGSQWRRILVAGQLAIAIALLFTATALSRSFVKLLDVSPGFSPEHVWTGAVSLPSNYYSRAQAIKFSQFFQELAVRISTLPGVESASAGSIPFSPDGLWVADLYFPGRPAPSVRPAAAFSFVLPRYFETMRIPLIEGRTFAEQDNSAAPMVAIVDQAFVKEYLPHQDPLGKLVANNGQRDKPYAIVGVVSNIASRDLAEAQRPEIYVPALQHPDAGMFLIARTTGNADVTSSVRDTLHSMDSTVALFDVETMPARILNSVKLRRFVAWLLDSFALAGVLLAALGLYGTLAHLIELRRREIAIRMALGASARSIRSLIARHSLSIAFSGLIPGVILSFFAIRATRSFLFGISPLDVWTVAATAIAFFALALAASWIPVLRATRINALAALREE